MGDLEDMLKEMLGDPRIHMMLYVFAFLVFTWVYKILLRRPIRPRDKIPSGFRNDKYRPPVFGSRPAREIWTPFDRREARRNAEY